MTNAEIIDWKARAIAAEKDADEWSMVALDKHKKAVALEVTISRLTDQLEMARSSHNGAMQQIDHLREALQAMLADPPPTLDEPDQDYLVIVKMREIARAALATPTESDAQLGGRE